MRSALAGATARLLSDIPILGPHLASWPKTSTALLALLGVALAVYLYRFVYLTVTLPFTQVPGPKPSSLFWGSMMEIIKAPPSALHTKWHDQYGTTFRYRGIMGDWRLCSSDPAFLSYVLSHDDLFHKPYHSQKFLIKILGPGLVSVEGEQHTRQRRVVSPAFSTQAIKDMAPIFFDKAIELREKLQTFVDGGGEEQPSATPPKEGDEEKGGRKIDMLKYFGQMAVDIIGEAGFGYDLASLSGHPKPLAEAFRVMMGAGLSPSAVQVFKTFVPGFKWIPTKADTLVGNANATVHAECAKLVEEKTQEVRSLGSVDKDALAGKDLLSLLLKSNLSPDLKPEQRMTDEDVFAQVTTFMLAGNETSSTALTWILYRLSDRPDLQSRLRSECAALDDTPSLDQINSLPFLESVVRESLRLDSPVPATLRVAQEDVTVPLANPITGRDGKPITEIRLRKGTTCYIPIHMTNWATETWGEDAREFNPDRYARPNVPASSVPSTWGNLLTFLYGPHNCIGYRFSLAEIKIAMFTLIRAFSFERLPSKPEFEARTGIVMRPRVVGEEEHGPQLPLLVRALEQ